MSLPTTLDDRRTAAAASAVAARAVAAAKVYGKGDTAVRALDDVSVDIPAARFTAVMGPSGSGKSTLMHCLAGLGDLTSGQVYVGDVELGKLSDAALTRVSRARTSMVDTSRTATPRPCTSPRAPPTTVPNPSYAGGAPEARQEDR